MKGRFFLLLVIIASTGLEGIAQFSVGVQVRPRGEYREGYRKLLQPNAESLALISQLTRIHVSWTKPKTVEAHIAIQDVRTWGETAQLADAPSLGIHQSWAKVHLSPTWFIKAGRQEIVWEDHRILGSVDWAQTGRAHDAALLGWHTKKSQLELGAAWNQPAELLTDMPYLVPGYQSLGMARWKQTFTAPLQTVLYGVVEGLTTADSQSTVARYTTGLWTQWQPCDPFKLTISGFYQAGTDPNRIPIGAYMFNALAEYSIGQFTLKAGYDHISGTSNGSSRNQSFHTLFGTNHKFYGHMDLFLNIPADTRNGGLQDEYFSLTWNPKGKWSFTGTLHHFDTEVDLLRGTGGSPEILPHNLGWETDLSFSYKPNTFTTLKGGYSWFSTSETLRFIQGMSNQQNAQWAWLMLDVQLSHFFETNEKDDTKP